MVLKGTATMFCIPVATIPGATIAAKAKALEQMDHAGLVALRRQAGDKASFISLETGDVVAVPAAFFTVMLNEDEIECVRWGCWPALTGETAKTFARRIATTVTDTVASFSELETDASYKGWLSYLQSEFC
eukprot:1294263-Lingulodinium_polyedra.AAC.1